MGSKFLIMARYPIGKQNFKSLREGGYIYIDKTRFIRFLLEGSGSYFLARPRRFGKSLFLSTLEYFFKGERQLFQDLDIDNYDWEWKEYPVIRIDLIDGNYHEDNALSEKLDYVLTEYETHYNITRRKGQSLSSRFRSLIAGAHAQRGLPVIVLVDEYDKPLVDLLDNPEKMAQNREILRGFYSVLKGCEEHLKLVFLTGITKFGQMNIFSGLNNLRDISLLKEFSTICGITEKELTSQLKEGICELAKSEKTDFNGALEMLKQNYDGYHFSADCEDIYNPFSLMNALADSEINSYWAATGTPKILWDILIKNDFDLEELDCVNISRDELMNISDRLDNPISLFYQTGYLTIKDYDKNLRLYTLGFPNREVEIAFLNYVLPIYSKTNSLDSSMAVTNLARTINSGEPEKMMQILSSFCAGISYEAIPAPETERHFQYLIYILFKLLTPYTDEVKIEEKTSDGRIDLLIKSSRFIYLIEIKRNKTPENALEQIKNKNYHLAFVNDPRRVFLIGVNFSTEKRRIDGWKIVE